MVLLRCGGGSGSNKKNNRMNNNFSIVIVCRNEAGNIGKVLESIRGLTDDILVYDNGSSDETIPIIKSFGVRLYEGEWLGFGTTKRKAVGMAKHDWVLCLDADESPDAVLQQELKQKEFGD